MAESYITRKGGGGAAVNGIIESYQVKAGETITAGDFVDYVQNQIPRINGFDDKLLTRVNSLLLSTNKVLMVYADGGDGDKGKAVILTFGENNITITKTTPFTFNTQSTGDIVPLLIDTNKILLLYSDYGNAYYGTARVLTISNDTLTAHTPLVYSSETSFYIGGVLLGTNKVLATFQGSNMPKAGVLNISGTTISAGVMYTVNTTYNNYAFISAALVDTDKVVYGYRGPDTSFVQILTISGNVVGNLAASPLQFNSGVIFSLQTHKIDTNKALLVYYDLNSSSNGFARVVTVSGTSMSLGSVFNFASSAISLPKSSIMANNKVAVFYKDTSDGNKGKFRILNISGTEITGETTYTVVQNNIQNHNSFMYAPSPTDKFFITFTNTSDTKTKMLIFNDPLNTSDLNEELVFPAVDQIFGVAKTAGTGGQTIDVYVDETARPVQSVESFIQEAFQTYTVASGETITAGTFVDYIQNLTVGGAASVRATSAIYNLISASVSDNKVLIVYQDNGNNSYPTAVVLTISGTSFTLGTPFVIQATALGNYGLIELEPNKFLFTNNNNVGLTGTARILLVSATTVSAPGSAFTYNSVNTGNTFLLKLSPTKVFITYYNNSTSRTDARTLTISGNSVSANGSIFSDITGTSTVLREVFEYAETSPGVHLVAITWPNSIRSIQVSGDTVTQVGSQFGTGFTYTDIKALKIENYRVALLHDASNNQIYMRIMSFPTSPGNSPTITSSIFLRSGSFNGVTPGLVRISGDKILGFYREQFDLGRGFYAVAAFNTTTYAFLTPLTVPHTTLVTSGVFDTNAIITPNFKIFLSYRNQSNLGFGIVFDYAQLIKNTNAEKAFGLAKTGGNAGQTIEVYTNK
jgi:hypothetical protein